MHTDTFESEGTSRNGLEAQIKVVIAYADLSAATIAKGILRESLATLSSRFKVKTNFWKFDLLSSPLLQEMAMQDATAAHIIIISTEKEYGLPEAARNWIETCLTRPHVKDVAFVALVRDNHDLSEDSVEAFEHFSARQKTDFFWFIANDHAGQRLAAEKIIQLAGQSSWANGFPA
jgi:hypothetical protein